MNCSNWEERIALYQGGDLKPAEAAEVERHLGDCPGCQVFASGLKESLEVLQEVHGAPIAAAHFAAVRARVLAELEGERRPWWRRGWVYGLSAAALALFLIFSLRPEAPVKRPPVAVQAPPVVVPAPEIVVAPPVVHRAHARRRRTRLRVLRVAAPANPGPPVVVKLLTDDPDVVIYWITDTSGE